MVYWHQVMVEGLGEERSLLPDGWEADQGKVPERKGPDTISHIPTDAFVTHPDTPIPWADPSQSSDCDKV